MGAWAGLKRELTEPPPEPEKEITISEFADIYLEEYCKVGNRRPDFKQEQLKPIKDILGNVKLREFSSTHAAYFEKEPANAINGRTDKPTAKATVNRGLAVLSHMMTFTLKKQLIRPPRPMARYGRLRRSKKLRV